jgi:hypothetical protein
MTDYQETLQLLRRREAEIERLADQNDVLRTVVRIIDTALAA